MRLKIAQVIGLNTDQKAAQVIVSQQDSDNTFLAVLDLSCDDAFSIGRQGLSELADLYFDKEGSAAEKLTATFAEARSKFATDENFNLMVGSISGKILYLLSQGDVEVYLKRDKNLSQLLSMTAPNQLISGFLQSNDRLLFSTKSLTKLLEDDLSNSLNLSTDIFEEEISSAIRTSSLEDQPMAGILVEIEEEMVIPTLVEQDKIKEQESLETYPQKPAKLFNLSFFKLLFPFKLNLVRLLPKKGRSRLILALVLLLLIGLGIGYKFKSDQEKQKQTQFSQSLSLSKDDFQAAKGLASLNPSEAKLKLDQASQNVAKALNLKPKDQEALDLKKQIEQDSPSILQQFQAQQSVFLDLDLIKKGFQAQRMSLSSNKLLILDPKTKTLIMLDLSSKNQQILAGEEQLGDAAAVSLSGNFAFVYSKDKGVLRIDSTNQKVTTIAKKDSDWGSIPDIGGFSSNAYILDSQNNQIWKYVPTTSGYSSKQEYFKKGIKVDLANSQSMQIESSIYVLKASGEMLRFTRGDKDNFGYEGLDKSIKDPKSFFVSSETDNLYLLDSGNSRLLVLTKTGQYKGQYQGEQFSSATDLVVDEKGKKVYLLEGSKIHQMDLK